MQARQAAPPRRPSCATGSSDGGPCTSSAPGSPASRAAVRLAERGRARRRARGGASRPAGAAAPTTTRRSASTIDNGNHLLLSGNWAALDYLDRIGAPADALTARRRPRSRSPTSRRASAGRCARTTAACPGGSSTARRRVPGSRARDYLAPLGILRAAPQPSDGRRGAWPARARSTSASGARCCSRRSTPSRARADARPRRAGSCARRSAPAGSACRPLVAARGLSAAFVDPALAYLEAHAASEVRFGRRLRGARSSTAARSRSLDFGRRAASISAPTMRSSSRSRPGSRPELLPGLAAPDELPRDRERAFPHRAAAGQPASPRRRQRPDANGCSPIRPASVTISGADRLIDDAARGRWRGRSGRRSPASTGLVAELPRWQIVKERRATFAATPAEAARRPPARTRLRQSRPGRRLDRDRPAGHHRGRGPLGLYRGGA